MLYNTNKINFYLQITVPTMSLCSLRAAPGCFCHINFVTLYSRREERPVLWLRSCTGRFHMSLYSVLASKLGHAFGA